MARKTDVYRVVFVDQDGNHTSLVFKEPVQGLSFGDRELFNLDGPSWATPNDEGEIPHREPSGDEGEDLGVTWHFQK